MTSKLDRPEPFWTTRDRVPSLTRLDLFCGAFARTAVRTVVQRYSENDAHAEQRRGQRAANETRLSDEEAEELSKLVSELTGLMVSVKVETEAPVAGAAVRFAERIRAELEQPDCRIQEDSNGADAVLGPISGDADEPGPALRAAMTALGGNWGDATVTTNIAGPVHYVVRAAEQSPTRPVLHGSIYGRQAHGHSSATPKNTRKLPRAVP